MDGRGLKAVDERQAKYADEILGIDGGGGCGVSVGGNGAAAGAGDAGEG